MRILFLTQVLPYPLDAGPKTRAYYVLRHLAQQHEVTLLSFTRPSDPPGALEHLRRFCRQVITVPMARSRWRDGLALANALLARRSFIITRDQRPAMLACLRQLLAQESFDFIHSDQLWMAQYALYARRLTGSSSKGRLVLDQHNAVYLIPQRLAEGAANPFLRWFMRLEAQRLARYEVAVCRQFDRVAWVSREDANAVASQGFSLEAGKDAVIPICVDPSDVTPQVEFPISSNILFIGGMYWPPNADGVRWFVEKILPLVRAELPAVRFCAVGKDPILEIRTLDGVFAPGYVDDLGPYWRQGGVFVVPLRAGGGMRVKILDAWLHSLPVVSTSIGAEGIGYTDGQDIAIANEPEEFANCLIRLLSQKEEYKRLGLGGRKTVEEHYNWAKIYIAWDQIYSLKQEAIN